MNAKALVVTAPNHVELADAEIPAPREGEALVEVAYSLVSPGTELRCMAGKQPGCDFPYIPGYAAAGVVLEAGPGLAIEPGTRVFCMGTSRCDNYKLNWGGHVSLSVQPAARLFPLPDEIDLVEAPMAKLAGIAHRGFRLSRPMAYEKVAAVGLGPIGQLSARLHAVSGAHVVGADLSEARVSLLEAAGVDAVLPGKGLAEAFASVFPSGADVVVDSTGVNGVFRQVFALAKDFPSRNGDAPRGARILMQGSYPGDVAFDYHDFFRKEASIHLPRDCQPEDIAAALDLMRRGKLKTRDLVSEVYAPERAAEAYQTLLEGKGDTLTVAFDWKD